MTSNQRRGLLVAVLLLAVGVLLGTLIARNQGANQYAQIGEQLGQRATRNAAVSDFKYVADAKEMLYWPNLEKYVEAIPKAHRVWIKDEETLSEFKSYKPGPR